MLKLILVTIAALLSYQVFLVDAGCSCLATNETCVMKCGQGLVQCIYACESNPTDACTNACLDIYWPIIGNDEDKLDIKLPFVKRDTDATVVPSGRHREEDKEGHSYGEKNHGDGDHKSHNDGMMEGEGRFEFPPEKGKEENIHFNDYDNFKDGPKEEFYPKDDLGPRQGYRNRSMAGTSEAFTKATVSIIALAIAGACMIAL